MLADLTSREFHKIIPIPSFLFAAGPILDAIVKNGLSRMMHAVGAVLGQKLFQAPLIGTFLVSSLGNINLFGFLLLDFLLLFFIKIVDILNDRHTQLSRFYQRRFIFFVSKKLVLITRGVFHSGVFANTTSGDLLEFVPIVHYGGTASPPFFKVVEHWLPRVVFASTSRLLRQQELLLAAVPLAF